MINAGSYNHRIRIVKVDKTHDKDGFPVDGKTVTVLEPYARVRTTSGYTLIKSGSDFERALTNFTIRCPRSVDITRDLRVEYAGRDYSIEYVNDVNEAGVELELQCKAVTH